MATGGHTRSSNILKHFECPICMEKFNVPRSLPKCLHNFCQTCLLTYLRNIAKESNPEYHCPVCRIVIDLSGHQRPEAIGEWVKKLPVNHVIVSLLDEVSEVESFKDHDSGPSNVKEDLDTIEEMCTTHKGRPLEYMCRDHDEILCESCVVKSHRRCDKVEDLETVLKDTADSTSQQELNCRIDEVRKALNKTVDVSRSYVDDIVNAEKIIENQISDFKHKLKVLNSLADSFVHGIMKSSKDASSILTGKEQDNVGIGHNWLLSLDDAQRKFTDTSLSAVRILKSRRSLLDIVAQCENFVDTKTHIEKQPLFNLELCPSLDNVLKDGFGRFIETGVNVPKVESPGTATPKLERVPQTSVAECVPPPTENLSIPSMSAKKTNTESSDKGIESKICASIVFERLDSVRVNVPRSRIPHYADATYLPDGRVVLVDSFHKRLVLLDQNLRFQSHLNHEDHKPSTVAYIGHNEVVVSFTLDEDSCDQFAVVTVQGKEMEVDHEVDISTFVLNGIAALNDEQVLVCTSNNTGKYCLSEMSIDNGQIASKLLKVNRQMLTCINGFTVDTTLRAGESLHRIYIHRGCDDCSDYRLVCINMNGEQIFVYSDEDLMESSHVSLDIDREGNVYLCNEDNIHVVSIHGEYKQTIKTDTDHIMAIAFNQKKDKFIITNNAWKERKLIEQFSVTYIYNK